MGRSYVAEESVEKHLANLLAVAGSCLTGLLIGHSSAQRDFIVLAVQTPRRENESEGTTLGQRGSSPLDDIDVEWASMHARQVARMLPGGVGVLGVFLIIPPELAKEAQNTLKRLIFAVDKYMSKTRLWDLSEDDITDRVALHICSKTRKAVCKTFDIKDPKCSAKPADWKYQAGISSSWPVVSCSVKLDLDIPVMSSENLEKCLKDGLRRWAKQIEAGVCLINGKWASDDSELLSGPKKNTKTSQQQMFQVQILVSAEEPEAGQRSSARVQACAGSVCVRGAVHCRAYVHSNKPKARQAAQAIKRDIVNTVSSRVEMLLEDLMNEGGPVSGRQALPRRVFAPLPGCGLSVCDYVFTDETSTDVAERLKEMLDWDSPVEDIDMSTEACCSMDAQGGDSGCDDVATQEVPAQSGVDGGEKLTASHSYVGVAVAAAVALLATATSLLYLTE